MEDWMIEALEQYHAEQEVMREEEESHNPSTCFCTEHWG